jgi:hypothetical protein
MTKNRVALIDWDEAHVDVADLDLALPYNAAERLQLSTSAPSMPKADFQQTIPSGRVG